MDDDTVVCQRKRVMDRTSVEQRNETVLVSFLHYGVVYGKLVFLAMRH